GLKELGELLGCHRLTEIVALSLGTLLGPKEDELLLRLHALGDDPLLQALAHADRFADDGSIVWVGGDPLHERLVDLEGVDRKPLQLAQAGITSAEVIDGKLHPEGFDGSKRDDRRLG